MFFDDFFGWDREFYNFERSIRDSAPYKIYRDEKEVTIIHNILGIDEKDLNVDIKQERNGNYLVIQGSTKDDYDEYSVESRFTIDLNKYQDISEIGDKLQSVDSMKDIQLKFILVVK